jgi:HAD superfamily hydrolase (TIGR01509 family)
LAEALEGSHLAPDLRGVELLCLDAGNTVIFLDHARLAHLIAEATGLVVPVPRLVDAEGEAKRRAERGELFDIEWSRRAAPGAASWGRMVGTIALVLGVSPLAMPALLDRAWQTHAERNLWDRVPAGLGDALDALRAHGVRVAIISNSEGMLDRLFTELGVLHHFDLVVDSGKVGFEKPDPRIYRVAFEHFGVDPNRALHLGDIFATDILGARAAGCRYALVDPFDHYAGMHRDVPRVPGAPETARALITTR